MEMSYRDISKNLQIATSTAHRIFKRFEETGCVKPKLTNVGGSSYFPQELCYTVYVWYTIC